MNYFAIVREMKGDLEIVGVTVTPEESIDKGYKITKDQVIELKKVLQPNKKVMVVNGIQHDKFEWFVEDVDPLISTKQNAKMTLKNHFSNKMNVVALFEMYNVMMINNELAANGYFITENNREEKYIDIINSGDEKLITLLQTYLEMKDRIDPMWEYYNKVKEFETTVDNMETVEEITTALNNLLSYIN